jgi:hypothetical protein
VVLEAILGIRDRWGEGVITLSKALYFTLYFEISVDILVKPAKCLLNLLS